jgi:hypothetical protein
MEGRSMVSVLITRGITVIISVIGMIAAYTFVTSDLIAGLMIVALGGLAVYVLKKD